MGAVGMTNGGGRYDNGAVGMTEALARFLPEFTLRLSRTVFMPYAPASPPAHPQL